MDEQMTCAYCEKSLVFQIKLGKGFFSLCSRNHKIFHNGDSFVMRSYGSLYQWR